MKDEELADEIIVRLNKLCEDKQVRIAIGRLIEERVVIPKEVVDHPTIQVSNMAHKSVYGIGFLGLLNGFIGTVTEGDREGWGFVAAYWGGEGEDSCIPENFVGFVRTDKPQVKPA